MSTPTRTGKIWDTPNRRQFIEQQEGDIDIPDGDPIRGQKIYEVACSGCHQLDDTNWLGPALRDVYNRKFGASKGFYYSKGMHSRKGEYWTRKKINQFLEDPESVIPETNMAFDGIKDAYDRACIIEYLHYLRTQTSS